MNKKLIQPLDLWEWEKMVMNAELAEIEHFENEVAMRQRLIELASAVMKMNGEIWRMRMTYGEETWIPVYKSDEDMAKERRQYELTRIQYPLKSLKK